MGHYDVTDSFPAPHTRSRITGDITIVDSMNPNAKAYRTRHYKYGSRYPYATYLTYSNQGLIPSQGGFTQYVERCNSPSNQTSRTDKGLWYDSNGNRIYSQTIVGKGAWGLYLDGLIPGVNTSDPWLVDLRNQSVTSAKLKAVDMKVNIGQVIGEFNQTKRLVGDTAITIAKAFRLCRHGRPDLALNTLTLQLKKRKLDLIGKPGGKNPHGSFPNKSRDVTKRVADSWLALQYGWLPLISDVKGSAELLAQHMTGKPLRWAIRASKKSDRSRSSTGLLPWVGGYAWGKYTEKVWEQAEYRTGYLVELTNPDLATLAQTGLDNPALLAWELLPYSFVVDWFYRVGDYLQALSAFRGLTVLDKWQSLLLTQTATVEYHGLPTVSGWDGATGRWGRRYYYRGNTVVDPPLVVNAGTGMNLVRTGNALALLATVFNTPPRPTPFGALSGKRRAVWS